MKNRKLVYLVKIALLSALSAAIMLLDFPLGFVPSFYKLDFSEVFVLLGTFSLGPVAGIAIEVLKVFLKLLIKPTTTAYVGELASIVMGISLVLPAGIIYKSRKTKKAAICGLGVGTVSLCFVSVLFNAFILLPFYAGLFKMPLESIIGMGTKIIPWIHDTFSFCMLAVLPFNIIKGVAVSFITVLLYKKVSPILHK